MPNDIRLFGFSMHDAKPLTGELADIVSKTPNDIIVVSFGSMGGKLPVKYVNKLLDTFERLNHTVIFSYSGDVTTFAKPPPSNVFLLPWLPQNDILGYNKTKLFITHCGHNGQSEALYHGVPMINMPLYFEQFHNAFRVQDHEFGITVNIHDFTVDSLYNAIQEVMMNPKYQFNVQRASRIVRSQREPKKVAADWIEHVMEFGGDHLRSAAFDMPWYQYFMLDILGLVIVVIIMFVSICVCVLKKLYTFVFKSPSKYKKE